MYKRNQKWLSAIDPVSHVESGWENQFTTVENNVVDIRFLLKGYGWKENANVENAKALEKGSYSIFYRVNGSPTWIFFTRAESIRADQSVANVYGDIGISFGLLGANRYDVKIVADKASKFVSWGGVIEGISSGNKFWSVLGVRAVPYKLAENSDGISVAEYAGANLV